MTYTVHITSPNATAENPRNVSLIISGEAGIKYSAPDSIYATTGLELFHCVRFVLPKQFKKCGFFWNQLIFSLVLHQTNFTFYQNLASWYIKLKKNSILILMILLFPPSSVQSALISE